MITHILHLTSIEYGRPRFDLRRHPDVDPEIAADAESWWENCDPEDILPETLEGYGPWPLCAIWFADVCSFELVDQ